MRQTYRHGDGNMVFGKVSADIQGSNNSIVCRYMTKSSKRLSESDFTYNGVDRKRRDRKKAIGIQTHAHNTTLVTGFPCIRSYIYRLCLHRRASNVHRVFLCCPLIRGEIFVPPLLHWQSTWLQHRNVGCGTQFMPLHATVDNPSVQANCAYGRCCCRKLGD